MKIELDEDFSARPKHIDYLHEKELIEYERLLLKQRSKKIGQQDENHIGLALSGGGIRSASFSLGFMQALARYDAFRHIDYLSTVSGGGYIGSSLTWFLSKKWDYGNGMKSEFGLDADNFPFGTTPNTHSEVPGAGSKEKMSILRHLRQNINYLFPGDGINPLSFFAVLLRGILFNFLVYVPVMALLLMLLAWVGGLSGAGFELKNLANLVYLAAALLSLILIGGFIYGLVCSLARTMPAFLYSLRTWYLKTAGYMLAFTIAFLVLASLPCVLENLSGWIGKLITASGITVGGVISGIWGYLRTGSSSEKKPKIPTGLIISIASILLIYGLFLLSYQLAGVISDAFFGPGAQLNKNYLWSFLIPIGIGFAVNINFITLHRYYRDRLMELFMPTLARATANRPAQPAEEANTTYIQQICNYFGDAVGPYHIINTNIMLPGSKITKFRGRGGDNFILSPLYCGSSATGWQRSDKYINGKFTYPTAMAVSGAAVNPNTGADGEGPTRNPLLSVIMGFLNLRLGVWVENPNLSNAFKYFKPNLWFPGLRDIFLPKFMNEESHFIELSDGGHFENLGVYELIRREVDLIIVCDGAADKDFKFKDFSNLVEKVRLDFGAIIDINLDPLIPKEGDNHSYGLEKLAGQGHAVGTIRYRNKEKPGFLVYIKTTLVPELPADIYGYKLTHESFPDESTGDQFFDEKQFEAYRELGFQLGKRMLHSLPAQLEGLLGQHAPHYEWVLVRFNMR